MTALSIDTRLQCWPSAPSQNLIKSSKAGQLKKLSEQLKQWLINWITMAALFNLVQHYVESCCSLFLAFCCCTVCCNVCNALLFVFIMELFDDVCCWLWGYCCQLSIYYFCHSAFSCLSCNCTRELCCWKWVIFIFGLLFKFWHCRALFWSWHSKVLEIIWLKSNLII